MLGIISLDLFAVLLGGTTALLPIFAEKSSMSARKGSACSRLARRSARCVMALLTIWPLRAASA